MVPKNSAVASVTASVKSSMRVSIERSSGTASGAGRDHAQKQMRLAPEARPDAQRAACEREHQAFGEQLADEACTLRAQGLPYGELARPRSGARQQQVGDVGAGDQQHQADDGHQDLQWFGELAAQVGEAGGHGSQRDVGLV